jgi:hypothetical protein
MFPKLKQKSFFIVLICILVAGSLANMPRQTEAAGKAKWTFMVYVAANNNLEPNSIYNMMEMAAVGSSADLNIVVQITRPSDYAGYYGEWGGTRRFLITKSDKTKLSSGDFQISVSRAIDLLKDAPPEAGVDPSQIEALSKMPRAEQEKALISFVPTIDAQLQLLPLQIEAVENLGDRVNSGTSDTLSAFGTWAVEKYPADHYGLIMWDHGGGWSMIASDDELGPAGIAMPEFEKALKEVTTQTGQKLDILGFDACLMGQLPVAVVAAPYAHYMIAAEELVPGYGWNYTPPLEVIAKQADADAVSVGKATVDGFMKLYTVSQADVAQSFDMGVYDLSKVDAVVKALTNFAEAIKNSPNDHVKAIATARHNVQAFGSVGEESAITDQISSVDLIDFMKLLGTLSKDQNVKAATKEVTDAAKAMVLYHKASRSLPKANGLSIYFPRNKEVFDDADGKRYTAEFGQTLSGWQMFLETFYGTALTAAQTAATTQPLSLHVSALAPANTSGSIHDVPIVTFDTDGKNIVGVTAYILYKLADGTQVILDTFPVVSAQINEDGNEIALYEDGVSTTDFYWNATLQEITDGKVNIPVLMTSRPDDEQHGFILGTFTDKRSNKTTDAYLAIDVETYEPDGVWAFHVSASGPDNIAQVTPQNGDTFEPIYQLIDNKGNSTQAPAGDMLTFGANSFIVNIIPAYDGNYVLILGVNDAAGNSSYDSATLQIKNSGLDRSQRAFKDQSFGVKFLYPWEWTDVQTIVLENDVQQLYASNIEEDSSLYMEMFTDLTSLDEALDQELEYIDDLSAVSDAGPEEIQVGNLPALTITYRYTNDEGAEIQGTALVVYVENNESAYVLTVEGPAGKAAEMKAIFDKAVETVEFFKPTE